MVAQGHPHLDPRQLRADAGVDALAEGDVRVGVRLMSTRVGVLELAPGRGWPPQEGR